MADARMNYDELAFVKPATCRDAAGMAFHLEGSLRQPLFADATRGGCAAEIATTSKNRPWPKGVPAWPTRAGCAPASGILCANGADWRAAAMIFRRS